MTYFWPQHEQAASVYKLSAYLLLTQHKSCSATFMTEWSEQTLQLSPGAKPGQICLSSEKSDFSHLGMSGYDVQRNVSLYILHKHSDQHDETSDKNSRHLK